MKTHLFAAALLASSYTQAQESRSETQAIRCAALSFVHTSMTASNPGFGEAMTQLAQLYGAVFGSSQRVRTGSSLTVGDINARREVVLTELKKSWSSNPEVVVREAALCNAWRADFAPRLAASSDGQSEAEFLRIVGQPPEKPSAEEVERWRRVVPVAFAAWAELDFATPSSTRKKVEESLRKP